MIYSALCDTIILKIRRYLECVFTLIFKINESLQVSPKFFSISQNTYNTDSTDQYQSGRQIIGLVGDNEKDALRRYNNLPENSLEQLGIFLQNPVTVASWSTNYPNAAIETNAVAGEEKLSDTPNVVILDARIMFDLESIVNLMRQSE